ncbi:hypothetical protein WH50_24305 [Pokkaliibacter plantistimulans]|uniref:Lipoprotein SmpA/OmlA domain-containing protein n=1 Tax=Pokkaliibacter plantistimulans TaxID=1635171 RepID=A0ABX5LQ65_9GAMM|nr:hypothetical protein [Pokkaliibacter plantistimulans]PXF28810.1 hypothetical protein WH50_24305 [Pokkaliibacter plantistimulans]
MIKLRIFLLMPTLLWAALGLPTVSADTPLATAPAEARVFGLYLGSTDRDEFYRAIVSSGGKRLFRRSSSDVYLITSIYPKAANCRVIFDADELVQEVIFNFNPDSLSKEELLAIVEQRYGKPQSYEPGLQGEGSYYWLFPHSGIRLYYLPTSTSQIQYYLR